MRLGERNFRRNCGLRLPPDGEMINGQAMGRVADLRYGLCRMSFNGCEVIAVYNALVYTGKTAALTDVARHMERYRMLMGIFGCDPYKIGKALEHFGVSGRRVKNTDGAQAFIMTFWTGVPLFSSVHTVFCVKTAEGTKVFNRYNNSEGAELFRSVSEAAGGHRIITIYRIL